jgi:hypothetical protein
VRKSGIAKNGDFTRKVTMGKATTGKMTASLAAALLVLAEASASADSGCGLPSGFVFRPLHFQSALVAGAFRSRKPAPFHVVRLLTEMLQPPFSIFPSTGSCVQME